MGSFLKAGGKFIFPRNVAKCPNLPSSHIASGPQQSSSYRDHVLSDPFFFFRSAGVECCGPSWAIPIGFDEISYQASHGAGHSRIPHGLFRLEPFQCDSAAFHETCHGKKNIVSILGMAPTRGSAKSI